MAHGEEVSWWFINSAYGTGFVATNLRLLWQWKRFCKNEHWMSCPILLHWAFWKQFITAKNASSLICRNYHSSKCSLGCLISQNPLNSLLPKEGDPSQNISPLQILNSMDNEIQGRGCRLSEVSSDHASEGLLGTSEKQFNCIQKVLWVSPSAGSAPVIIKSPAMDPLYSSTPMDWFETWMFC